MTSPKEIAEHTGLDVETVSKHLLRSAKKREGKVVVRLTNPQAKRTRPNV